MTERTPRPDRPGQYQNGTRRGLVKMVGAAVLGSLAGCIGTSDEDGQETTKKQAHEQKTKENQESDHQETAHEGEHGSHGDVVKPVAAAEVTMLTNDDGMHFDPHVIRVTKGGTVTWTLDSGAHTATAYHPDNDSPRRVPEGTDGWDSGLLSESGETFEHTFEEEGVYDYFCEPHEDKGMIGTVIVGEPDSHGQAGLAEPQDDLSDDAATKIKKLNERANTALGHEH